MPFQARSARIRTTIKPEVSTLCTGFAASMGSFLLAAGATGKRHALPNARIMIYQPHGGSQGVAADIEIQAREVLYQRHRLNTILANEPDRQWRRSKRIRTVTITCRPARAPNPA